jgi:hypothetical protein
LKVGDKLVGFDESPDGGCRKLRTSVVERVEPLLKPSYDLSFSDGTQLRASYDHQWLRRARPMGEGSWIATENMRVKGKRSSSVSKCFPVWDELNDYDSGYLAAALDGEGCLAGNSAGNHKELHFSQRDNNMWVEVKRILDANGYDYSQRHLTYSSLSTKGYERLVVGRREQMCRLLGSVRPKRLLEKFNPDSLGSLRSEHITLTEKKDVGVQTVIAVQTSTRTFIAEGIASHNCTIAEAAHAIGAWTVNSGQAGGEALFSDEAITQFYSLCGGYVPGNPSTDNGCVMSTVFADWTQTGITDTKGKLHTLQAYAQLADTSESFLNWGLKNFGSVHLGINCPQSAEDQFSAGQPWSYVQGSPVIGGHAVALQENQAPGEYAVVTWGALQLVEQDFFDHYLEEAWVALSYDWLTIHSNSITGLDVAQLVVDMGLLRTS